MSKILEKPQKFYVRLPIRIENEQQVLDLHSDIDKVIKPRQSGRWCKIVFKTNVDIGIAVKQLKKQKINGKLIVVKIFKNKKIKK